MPDRPLPHLAALAVAGLALLRGTFALAGGDLDRRAGAVVLGLLALVVVAVAALLRAELGTGARVFVLVVALGCALAAWGDLGVANAETVGDVRVADSRAETGGAVVSAGVAAAAVAGAFGRRVHPLWAGAAVLASLVVPPAVVPTAGLPLLLLGLRQEAADAPGSPET